MKVSIGYTIDYLRQPLINAMERNWLVFAFSWNLS